MKRVYFLVPDIETTRKIVDELRKEGMEDRHIHILAQRDTPMEDIPEAGIGLNIAGYPLEIIQTKNRVVKTVKIFPVSASMASETKATE